ncbi:hypothetical protein [Pseudomonas sp. P7548]|uniref:hypothetical protein n=1 Tax=Pseudomonas sp. P7548 TaxID=2726981 RepID=UPI0015C005BE|nr:hypothetical protein [Pseudomonas sp. P7548]NWE22598.1 hypothetical protein [Pseudomonas sp. P7548]
MLTDFYLDRSVFDAAILKEDSCAAIHDVILEYWKRYGILIVPNSSAQEYLDSIKTLPPKFHQRWITAFTDYSKFRSSEHWGECGSYPSFQKVTSLSEFFTTALAEDTISAVICDNEKTTRFCFESFFELVGIGAITESIHFNTSKDSSTKDIAFNSDLNKVWQEKFNKFTQFNSKIFISDRFVFSSVLRDHDNGYKSSVAKFIEMLPLGKKFNITILSDGDLPSSQKQIEVSNFFTKHIMNSPPLAQKISSLKLVSMGSLEFQKFAHDRYIRFDRHVCQIGVGMAIFERYEVPATTFTVKMRYESTALNIERVALTNLWYEVLEP